MRTSLGEKFTEWAVLGFLWGFRILIIAVVVLGTIGTIRAGKYSQRAVGNFVDAGHCAGQHLCPHCPGIHHGVRHPAHDQLRPRGDIHGGAFGAYFLAIPMSHDGLPE